MISEVISWCAESGLQVVNTIPKTIFGDKMCVSDLLFAQSIMGGRLKCLPLKYWNYFQAIKRKGFLE